MHVCIPTTVDTYLRALYSSTMLSARGEHRSTHVCLQLAVHRRAHRADVGVALPPRRQELAELIDL